MAAPTNVNIRNLSGRFTIVRTQCPDTTCWWNAIVTDQQNKTLSDDVDAILTLQGLSWLTRKAIGLATVVVCLYPSLTVSDIFVIKTPTWFTLT